MGSIIKFVISYCEASALEKGFSCLSFVYHNDKGLSIYLSVFSWQKVTC